MALEEWITYQNPHWEGGFLYPFHREREIVGRLKGLLREPIIKVLIGPRRVGKTTVIKQLINHLIKEGVKRQHILYYSFEERESILEVVKAYEALLGIKVGSQPLFLFFDEVQYAPRWREDVKRLYDTYSHNLYLFLSGSASLTIRKGRESLAGRMLTYTLDALTYGEYLLLTGARDSEREFQIFLKRQLPFLALHPSIEPKEYVKEVVKKAIYGDALVEGIEEPEVLDMLFLTIASQPGSIVKIEELSQEFGVSRNTISRYINVLEELYLIRRVYNYRGSIRKSAVKSKKIYPYYATLSTYGGEAEKGLLYETYVAQVLRAEYFWRKGEREIDFYIPAKQLAVEVKAKQRVKKRELSTLCTAKIPIKERWVITEGEVEAPCPLQKIPIRQLHLKAPASSQSASLL